ncbi:hypothetical protein P171DRAFT_481970 [Karstenula rhodostoma CBS 690.94]|uniref:Uncharacterized protein n=1 Tax=Karstenula rhodostoma CBS 690.94 TaxID=1392251 RepID=A0A9P4PUA6_9PLEO|nr:hypothetical protein P171DRAFT_481970 [Karstenula rhodostoma CBS 690.94]
MNIVLETNITSFVSVGIHTFTERVIPKQHREVDTSLTDPACTGKILPITCFSMYTISSSVPSITSAPSSHVEPSSSKTPDTTSAAPSGKSTSAAPTTSPTETADRLRECFLGSSCGSLFSNLTSFWKELHADAPMDEQDKEFAQLYCVRENRVNFELNTQALWNTFRDNVVGFCEGPARSVYAFSKQLLLFKKEMIVSPLGVEPAGFDPIVERMVEAWDKNGKSTRTSTATATSSPAGLPTQALTQLPRAWPYTRAAVARRPGMTARFTVTGRNGEVEGVVVESMVW